MQSLNVVSAMEEIRRRETQFFDSLPLELKQRFADDGMDLKNMYMIGEITFLLIGLKPAVLFDNFKGDLFSLYSKHVLEGVILNNTDNESSGSIPDVSNRCCD
jgi:hypothetical protein